MPGAEHVLRVHASDPSPLLEAAFARIEREQMDGVAILNPCLKVQALGFTRWQGHWLGVVVTPWFMNLVLVPGNAATWRPVADGERVFHRFGVGHFAFLGGYEAEVGEFQSCSLISPMAGFADQAGACAAAREALRMLLAAAPAPVRSDTSAAPAPDTPGEERSGVNSPSRRLLLFGGRRAVHHEP